MNIKEEVEEDCLISWSRATNILFLQAIQNILITDVDIKAKLHCHKAAAVLKECPALRCVEIVVDLGCHPPDSTSYYAYDLIDEIKKCLSPLQKTKSQLKTLKVKWEYGFPRVAWSKEGTEFVLSDVEEAVKGHYGLRREA